MMIALTRTIVDNEDYDPDKAALSYMDFAAGCPFLGKNTRALFYGVKTLNGYRNRVEKIIESSEGNGCLMRAAPLSVFKTKRRARLDCNLTNPNESSIECCEIYHSLLRKALKDSVLEEIDLESSFEKEITGKKKGWCYIPLYIYSQTVKELTYRETVESVIRKGGDCDTNACILGSIWGAKEGFQKIMEDPITKENWEVIYNADTNDGDYPRPYKYHPKELVILSKELNKLFQN